VVEVSMEKQLSDARRLYLEQYGSALVTNTYLRVALFAVSVVLLGTLALSFMMFSWARNQKPLVVRIDDVGRATAVNYAGFAYTPEAPELRYFLAQFVELHYARRLGSVEDSFGRSLFFLDAKLSRAVIEEERKSLTITQFIREGPEEIDIDIKNIVLQDLKARPMKASVDFDKVFYARGDRKELRRERYAGSFEFVVQDNVPNAFVLVNPLGITISYFRVDAAFK
jgi:type IV secretory pathway TrbF-like protein